MRFLLLLFLLLPGLALAFTSPRDTVNLVQTGPETLALEFQLAPGWHIYWKNPGTVGYPPSVTLAPPARAGALEFPPPEKLVQGNVISYVLSGHVVLPFAVSFAGGTVNAKARWLVCADTCVPEHADFTLAIAASAPRPPYGLLALLALLGGLILNLMPCVFPILAMKAVSLCRLGGSHRTEVRRAALGYGAGVIVSMLALAAALLGARAAGQAAFWGFQFQSPVFVALAGWVILAAALGLAGLFHVRMPGFVARLPARGSFFTGLLAVLVATPCTAPFMGAAIAGALALPVLPALGIFAALGFGMALPVLVLALAPGLAGLLPRPGAWMLWLQRILAIPMAGAFIWLAWVLYRQAGLQGLLVLLAGSVVIALALWKKPVAVLASLLLLPLLHTASVAAPLLPGAEPYSAARLASLRAAGQPVFVDLTAAWCVSCLVNEETVLNTGATRALFAQNHVTVLVGDWTSRDPEITALLDANHRAGVPLYLYYAPGRAAPVILPQLLTQGLVKSALNG